MATLEQFEGTWEEILDRADRLAGKRVRVTVLEEVNQEELRRRAYKLMAEIDAADSEPVQKTMHGASSEFADAVVEKLQRQGIES